MGFKRPFHGKRLQQTCAHELSLAKDLFLSANQKLQENGAFIRLYQLKPSQAEGASATIRVGVSWVSAPLSSYQSDLNDVNATLPNSHTTSTAENRTYTIKLWADCFRISAAVCGATMDVVGNITEKSIVALVKDDQLHAIPKLSGENVNIASRLASAVVLQILKLKEQEGAGKVVVDNFSAEKKVKAPAGRISELRAPAGGLLQAISGFEKAKLKHVQTSVRTLGCIDGKGQEVSVRDEQLQQAWDAYGHMYLSKNSSHQDGQSSSLFEKLGLNEYCEPRAGELLVTVPATFAKNWGRFVQSNYNPNFHFAPCVLVDELENVMVTLENWAFCVYSLHPRPNKSLPTYHEALTGTGGYGNIALTFCAREAVSDSLNKGVPPHVYW